MKIRRFTDALSMSQAVADALAAAFGQSLSGPFAVMLSGGNTPLPAYRKLAAFRVLVSPGAHVFFSDERHVPATSSDSNYGRIRFLFEALRLPDERIFAVPTDQDLQSAADVYDATLRGFLTRGGRITLGLLGVGADGHTASLFTPTDLENARHRYAIAVPRPVKPDRVSVTPLLLQSCQRILLLIAGPDKKEITRALIKNPADVIAGRAIAECRNVECWIAP